MKKKRIADFRLTIEECKRVRFRQSPRGGFTLIELLVSVTLAIIILGLFGYVYEKATSTYAKNKGIRRNDQRSRMLSTVIKGDLRNRSFKDVVPFWPNQDTGAAADPNYNPDERRGYFTISENDPNNPTDDVLQFTTVIPPDGKQLPYYGRSSMLYRFPVTIGMTTYTGVPSPEAPFALAYLALNPNQPEFDDGNPVPNQTGASRAAEISYFLRGGNLYRRVLLIRDPYDDEGQANSQPDEVTGDYGAVGATTGFFWEDFAYSGYHKTTTNNSGMRFHTINQSLRNEGPTPTVDPDYPAPSFPISLGIPALRFGYSYNRGAALRHLPREYVDDGAGGRVFIGRFLAQETADQDFLYPGRISANGDPHARTDLRLNTTTNVINQYNTNTTRRGEDILMTNVHEFDIKVWDDVLARFVDLGHNDASGNGHYHQSRNRRTPNFPGTANNRFDWNRFDTWHPYRTTAVAQPMGLPPYKVNGAIQVGNPRERPLRAIQLTIRFFDQSSRQMRQVTIVESLKK